MFGASFLTLIWIVWGTVTGVFVALMIWKSVTGLQEDNLVILDAAESRLANEQQAVVAKVQRLTLWAKCFGFASLALLLVSGGVWVYRGIIAFNGGQLP